MPSKSIDYKDVLIEKYESMRARRPGYSLRQFALKIGLTPSNLSDIFKGRCGLSAQGAEKIARSLEMDESERKLFVDLVQSRHARSKTERDAAARRLEERERKPFVDVVSQQELHVISKWYYVAALELVTITNGKIDASDLSRRLSITEQDASEAFETLRRLGLLEWTDGRWVRLKDRLLAESPTPSSTIRNYHQQILDLAGHAVFEQPMSERKVSATMMSFDSSRMNEARAFLDEMNDEFFRRFEATSNGDSVRAFSFQFFRVDDNEKVN